MEHLFNMIYSELEYYTYKELTIALLFAGFIDVSEAIRRRGEFKDQLFKTLNNN